MIYTYLSIFCISVPVRVINTCKWTVESDIISSLYSFSRQKCETNSILVPMGIILSWDGLKCNIIYIYKKKFIGRNANPLCLSVRRGVYSAQDSFFPLLQIFLPIFSLPHILLVFWQMRGEKWENNASVLLILKFLKYFLTSPPTPQQGQICRIYTPVCPSVRKAII